MMFALTSAWIVFKKCWAWRTHNICVTTRTSKRGEPLPAFTEPKLPDPGVDCIYHESTDETANAKTS